MTQLSTPAAALAAAQAELAGGTAGPELPSLEAP